MTITVNSLSDLVAFQAAQGGDKLVFRGQGNADWGLVPSMYRGMDSLDLTGWESSIEDRERDIFREFSDRSLRFLTGKSPLETLAVAQHHGTPTRLLDWTSNSYQALYFACASTDSSDGALWCANPSKLPMPDIGRIHKGLGFRRERLRAYIAEQELPFCQEFSKAVVSFASDKSSESDNSSSPGVPSFDQNGNPDLSGILAFFLPRDIDDRVAAQLGLFSIYLAQRYTYEVVVDHGEYLRTVERNFNTHILEKLIIPGRAKGPILASLEQVGMDASRAYPDLQGLGLHLSGWQRQFAEEIRSYPT